MDGRLMPSPVGWMELCFNHPVVCCCLSLSLTTPTFPLSPCCLYIVMSLVRRQQQPAMYASEQVCIGWHRTGACYTDKLNIFPQFFHQSLGCVLYKCAYYIRIFTVLIFDTPGTVLHIDNRKKPGKWCYSAACWHPGNVVFSNITLCDFVVLDV